MSTTEKIKDLVKPAEYPSSKNHQEVEPFVHFVRYERFGFVGYLPVRDGCVA